MYKRWMSLLLAMILTVSLVLPGNAVALTTDEQENTEAVDETIETTGTAELSDPTEASESASDTTPSDMITEWMDEGISVMSMRPIPEVFCSLVLYNFSEAEIEALTIDDVLLNLKDANGNSVSVSESATTAWRYVLDETDNIETYETYTLGVGEKIDLSYAGDASAFQLQLIVGSGGQLASDSICHEHYL